MYELYIFVNLLGKGSWVVISVRCLVTSNDFMSIFYGTAVTFLYIFPSTSVLCQLHSFNQMSFVCPVTIILCDTIADTFLILGCDV